MAGSVPIGIRLLPSMQNREKRNFCYRIFILVFTFLCYMSYHLSRKPISIVKSVLHRKNCSVPLTPNQHLDPHHANNSEWCDWAPFNHDDFSTLLGSLDLAYLFAYAVGMFFSGHLAERLNLRYFLSVGMISSGIMTAVFGIGYFGNFHRLWFYVGVQVIGGLVQSTGWPSVVTCVGNWYGKGKRGLIMGIWNSHTSVGNILGSLIAGAWVNHAWGWSFVVPGIIIGSLGVLVFLFLVTEPSIVDCEEPQQHLPEELTPEVLRDPSQSYDYDSSGDYGIGIGDGKKEPLPVDSAPPTVVYSNEICKINLAFNPDELDLKKLPQPSDGACGTCEIVMAESNAPKLSSARRRMSRSLSCTCSVATTGETGQQKALACLACGTCEIVMAESNVPKLSSARRRMSRSLSCTCSVTTTGETGQQKALPCLACKCLINIGDSVTPKLTSANGVAGQQEVGGVPKFGRRARQRKESTSLLSATNSNKTEKPEKAISFVRALLIPGVIEFSLCLFFAKLVSYTFLFWLPKYISANTNYGAEEAGDLSTLFDVGGIAGGIMAGVISDYTGARASTCCIMLTLAAPVMFIYNHFGSLSHANNIGLLLICGFMVNGPYALITTAVSADLGTHKSLRGNSRALSTVTAIIDGTGSIGAAVGPLMTGVLSKYGWNDVFWMLIGADLFAMVFLIRLVYKEFLAANFRLCMRTPDSEIAVQVKN